MGKQFLLPLYTLPSERRRDFSHPRGIIIRGDLKPYLEKVQEPLFCIGDVVSMYCSKINFNHMVLVVDLKTRRRELFLESPQTPKGFKKVKVKNPPGSLSHNAILSICHAAKVPGRWYIYVEGEEDMTALAAIACSPRRGTVVYGVPGKGATIIRLNIYQIREAQSRFLELEPRIHRDLEQI